MTLFLCGLFFLLVVLMDFGLVCSLDLLSDFVLMWTFFLTGLVVVSDDGFFLSDDGCS